MNTFPSDPLTNAIQQIKRGIDVTIDIKCFGSAIILIYCAMDAMAFLRMPDTQEDVTRTDFAGWADLYIKFPSTEQVTGLELYGARCGTLHNFGVKSKLSRKGKVRYLGYAWGSEGNPAVKCDAAVDTTLVIVSIEALRDALFTGLHSFLVDVFADPSRRTAAEARVPWLLNTMTVDDLAAKRASS